MKIYKLFVLVWLAQIATVEAASFDCAKANSKIEKLICNDNELSLLDEKLNLAYKAALQDAGKLEATKQAQKKWLQDRNRCADAACIGLAYQNRISALSTNSSESNATGHKILKCPQCGTWNIFQADVVMPKNSTRAVLWAAPIGETLFADEKVITIPDCGSFSYTTTASTTREESTTKYLDVTMQLKKTAHTKFAAQCESENWTLHVEFDDLEYDDGELDEDGWGGAYFVLDNLLGKKLRLRTWNPNRRDLVRYGTPGEGQLLSFQLHHLTNRLSTTTNLINKKYAAYISAPFDIDQFHDNAQKYCEKQYEDTPHNPSTSNRELECETYIYEEKLKEFESWRCNGKQSGDLKKPDCKLPVEAIDESKDYSQR
jgi:uncharacterized protein